LGLFFDKITADILFTLETQNLSKKAVKFSYKKILKKFFLIIYLQIKISSYLAPSSKKIAFKNTGLKPIISRPQAMLNFEQKLSLFSSFT
jgi:hypothetical protein